MEQKPSVIYVLVGVGIIVALYYILKRQLTIISPGLCHQGVEFVCTPAGQRATLLVVYVIICLGFGSRWSSRNR